MRTIFMIALMSAALFGSLMFAGSLIMLCIRQLRAWGTAALAGGLGGALAAFALFAALVVFGELGGRSLFSQLSASIAAAGFGTGAFFGATALSLSLLMQSPSRWADRRRLKH
jgi:hypothetical protein